MYADMFRNVIMGGAALLLLSGCKAKVPETVLERDVMEEVLYDYHLAQSLAKRNGDSTSYYTRLYTEAVFRKHGIDGEQFDRSMTWYTRNSEELFEIYKKMDKKFAEVNSSGKVQGNPYALMTAPGDTMNIWGGKEFYILSNLTSNLMQFEQPADSTWGKGDKLLWQFETHWYYRDGQKNAMVELALVYDNDSVAVTSKSLYNSTGVQDVSIRVGDRKVKSIQGFIFQSALWSDLPRMLTVSEPVLVKFKRKEPLKMKEVNEEKAAATLPTEAPVKPKEAEPVVKDTLEETLKMESDSRELEPKQRTNRNERILHLPR